MRFLIKHDDRDARSLCEVCFDIGTHRCSGCLITTYCSTTCFLNDEDSHQCLGVEEIAPRVRLMALQDGSFGVFALQDIRMGDFVCFVDGQDEKNTGSSNNMNFTYDGKFSRDGYGIVRCPNGIGQFVKDCTTPNLFSVMSHIDYSLAKHDYELACKPRRQQESNNPLDISGECLGENVVLDNLIMNEKPTWQLRASRRIHQGEHIYLKKGIEWWENKPLRFRRLYKSHHTEEEEILDASLARESISLWIGTPCLSRGSSIVVTQIMGYNTKDNGSNFIGKDVSIGNLRKYGTEVDLPDNYSYFEDDLCVMLPLLTDFESHIWRIPLVIEFTHIYEAACLFIKLRGNDSSSIFPLCISYSENGQISGGDPESHEKLLLLLSQPGVFVR